MHERDGADLRGKYEEIYNSYFCGYTCKRERVCDTEGGHGDGTDVGNGGVIGGTDKDDGNDNQNNGGTVKPPEPVIPTVPAGSVKITEAAGDLEAAYVIWDKVDGAMSYNVYCKADGGEYVKIDAPLVREYKDYCRADAVGLKAGKYEFKVVPTGARARGLRVRERHVVRRVQRRRYAESGCKRSVYNRKYEGYGFS